MDPQTQILTFEVVRQGGVVYNIWPWRSLTQFLLDANACGVRYEIAPSHSTSRRKWSELRTNDQDSVHGEYQHDLLYSFTPLGWSINRNQAGWSTHYLTQHGLDGIPKRLWEAAYEYEPGMTVGSFVRFVFKIHSDCGLFELSFFDWQHYFASGRNSQKLSDLAIQIIKSPAKKEG